MSKVPWAIYSGYEIDVSTLGTLITNIPEIERLLYAPADFGPTMLAVEYFLAYARWRWHLPKPLKKQVPPILIVRTLDGSDARNPTPLEGETRAFLFPMRCIDYKGEEQFEEDHPDYAKHATERETDQARLNVFIEFVENRGGVLNRDMVRFSSLKERHPKVHPTLY